MLINYLLLKAIPPIEPPNQSNIREWTYCDIARLPKAEQSEWRKACEEELEALRRRKVFEIVDRPQGTNVVKNRWVFDVKSDGRKKARLVAKGFSQIEGLDFDQIFSPVVNMTTLRCVLALVARMELELAQMVVKTTFLHGDLHEEIYMQQPEGLRAKAKLSWCVSLRKACMA